LGGLFVLFGLAPSAANATQPNPEHKVTLCHATDSYSNPYVRITVDVASVLHNGHDGHNGPVFYAAIPKHTKWGDVIPPFNFGPGEVYAGKNWTAIGIAVFDNGCAIPSTPSTTASTSTTAPPPPPPPTTSTIPVVTSTTSSSTTTSPGGSTTTTTTTVPETTSSSPATTTTISTVTTEGGATTTVPGGTATSTTISNTVVTLGSSSTTVAPGNGNAPLPFTGGNSGAAIAAGLVLIAAGFGLTRRIPLQP
jgi:hypothetical protein